MEDMNIFCSVSRNWRGMMYIGDILFYIYVISEYVCKVVGNVFVDFSFYMLKEDFVSDFD